MYPLLLNLDGRLAVVVGNSDAARRKARALFDAKARVRFVSEEKCTADGLTGRLEWICEPYRVEHLNGASLVIAAATPELNRRVIADAHARGILVNSAGEPEASDFVLPSTIRHGNFVLAIGTGGAAPALTQRIREQLELAFDKAFGEWVELLAEMRPIVRSKIADSERRAAVAHALSDWSWLEQIRANGSDRVRLDMLAAIDSWASESAPTS
jgi:precorrin-2 dehydrogenase/sirohydrochlorin ferrochelatase